MGTHGFCGTCTWQENRRCHYFPPPVWQNSLEMPRSQWPLVDPDTDWCSQHAPVAQAQEEKPLEAPVAKSEPVPWRIESEPPAGIDPEEFVEPDPDPEDGDKPHHHPHRRRKAHR